MVVVSKTKVYCVSYDWLSFSVRLKNADAEIECPDNWRMDIFPGTNVYKNRAILRDPNGCKVLTFCWCPYSKVLMPNICTVQVANSCLYDADLTFVMPLLNACVECVFNSWSRIDICVDFQCSDRQLAMIRKLNSGALFVSAKSEGSVWWHETNWNGVKSKFPHCLTWGSATSMFKWKLYNKSREQNQEQNQDGNSEKPYIVAMWKDAGLDVTKVWRLELSMTDSGGLRLDGHKLSFEEILAEWFKLRVFNDMYERRFVMRESSGKKRKSREQRVWLFRFDMENLVLKRYVNAKPKPRPEVITQFRGLLRLLESPVSMASDDVYLSVYSAAATMVEKYHLELYCMRVLGKPFDEWAEEKYSSVGSGIHQAVPSLEREID